MWYNTFNTTPRWNDTKMTAEVHNIMKGAIPPDDHFQANVSVTHHLSKTCGKYGTSRVFHTSFNWIHFSKKAIFIQIILLTMLCDLIKDLTINICKRWDKKRKHFEGMNPAILIHIPLQFQFPYTIARDSSLNPIYNFGVFAKNWKTIPPNHII